MDSRIDSVNEHTDIATVITKKEMFQHVLDVLNKVPENVRQRLGKLAGDLNYFENEIIGELMNRLKGEDAGEENVDPLDSKSSSEKTDISGENNNDDIDGNENKDQDDDSEEEKPKPPVGQFSIGGRDIQLVETTESMEMTPGTGVVSDNLVKHYRNNIQLIEDKKNAISFIGSYIFSHPQRVVFSGNMEMFHRYLDELNGILNKVGVQAVKPQNVSFSVADFNTSDGNIGTTTGNEQESMMKRAEMLPRGSLRDFKEYGSPFTDLIKDMKCFNDAKNTHLASLIATLAVSDGHMAASDLAADSKSSSSGSNAS